MEEKFISGYCRQVDGSRMVTLEYTDAEDYDADCCYGSCPSETECTVAQAIRAALTGQD